MQQENGLKLGVIGEPCIDFIHREGQVTAKHLGGILYSAVSLAVIAGKNDEIYPMMNLGEDEYGNITSFLTRLKNVRLDFVYKSSHKTRIVKLYYKTGSSKAECQGSYNTKTYDREESSTEPALPLTMDQMNPAVSKMEGLLVNMVSGFDLNLETLSLLRERFKGYIHMDLHNIVMRTGADGRRFRGPVKDWANWCINCDTLQMNEAEISALSAEGLNEYNTAEKILNNGNVKSVTITRGNLGVSMYEKRIKKNFGENYTELDKIDLASIETPNFKDSTGCGDVFASAFFYKSLENNLSDLSASLHYANRMAGRKSELTGVEELEKLNG